MKFRLLLVFTILSICGCKKVTDISISPLSYVPEQAGVIVKINNISQLKSELKNNTFIASVSGSNAYAAITEKLRLLNLIETDTSALLSFSSMETDTIEYLLVLPLLSKNQYSDSLSNSPQETLQYENLSIERRQLADLTIYSTTANKQLLISSSTQLLASAVNNSKDPLELETLKSLYKISNPKKSATFFIKNNSSQALENVILKEDSQIQMSNYSEWISLDLDGRPDDLKLSGVSLTKDDKKGIIDLFTGTPPMVILTPAIAPSTTDAILAFSLSDYNNFAFNQKEYLGNSFVLDSLFNAVEEIGHIYIGDQKAVVIHTYASENITEFLQNNKTGSFDFQGNEITSLSKNEFLNNFFEPLITKFRAQHYTVLDNAFVFSSNRKVLEEIISHYNRKSTFNLSPIYRTIEGSLADESSILYISNSDGLETVLTESLRLTLLADFKKAKTSKYVFAGQMVADDQFFHTNLAVKEVGKNAVSNTISPVFSIQIEEEVTMDPQFVLNHRTGKKEILVQDISNNLYLISTDGKVLWKKKLAGKIQGKVSQVDIYKNGRLQLAFTTSNQFIILDRNGKEVRPFVMKFEGGNLNPLAVFDYDGNKKYRFVVTQGTKVFMYNSRGDIVKGFKYTEAENNVLFAPQHFRIGQKDYLIFMLENGILKILSREGKPRVIVKELIEFSENKALLYKNKFTLTDKNGTLFVVDQRGGITKSKLNLNEDHGIDATSKTLVTMNDNVLTIKGKKISLELGVYTKPQIFYIYDKIYVGVTDLQSQQTYLFDSNAKTIANFPIVGVSLPDLADMDKDKKVELLTKESDNSIVVYKLN